MAMRKVTRTQFEEDDDDMVRKVTKISLHEAAQPRNLRGACSSKQC